jgi:guanylate kinase
MTTRPRRRDEIDGVHHFFVGHDEFDRMVAGGHLLEWAQIAGDRYGTSRDETLVHLWACRPVLLLLDERGVDQVRASMPDARVVRLVPRAVAPAPVAGRRADTLVVVDSAERAVDELVGLLGSSFLAPARQSG